MEAIRTVIQAKNNQIQITLPDSFNEAFVEVIVLPYNQKDSDSSEKKKIKLQNLLLEAPIMSDVDYNEFLEKRKHFNQWKPLV